MTTGDRRRDEGMSLVEVLVALGVFGVLMVVVSAFFISGFGAIRDANALSSVQQEQRNAVLFISKMLRYIDNETEGYVPGTAIKSATATEMRFFTNSGIGSVNGYPYDVTVRNIASGVNAGVVAEIREPVVSNGVVTSYTTLPTRVLVRSAPGHVPTLGFTYYTTSIASGSPVDVVSNPPSASNAAAFAAWAQSIDKIKVTITDSGSGLISQQLVSLVNPL